MTINEIEVGQYITVDKWKTGDQSWCGDVLKVLAICGPYVAVQDDSMSFDIDSRQCTLMRLSDEYVNALAGHDAPETQIADFPSLIDG